MGADEPTDLGRDLPIEPISNPDDELARDALGRSIGCRLLACSLDELRVIDEVLMGLERGRDEYGPLDLGRDDRDFEAEADAELRDCLFYLAAHRVAQRRAAVEGIERDVPRQNGRSRALGESTGDPIVDALREFRDAPAETRTRALFEFDMSDLEDVGGEG